MNKTQAKWSMISWLLLNVFRCLGFPRLCLLPLYLLLPSSLLISSPLSSFSSHSVPPPSSFISSSLSQNKLEPKASTFLTFNATQSSRSLSLSVCLCLSLTKTHRNPHAFLQVSLPLTVTHMKMHLSLYLSLSLSLSLAPLSLVEGWMRLSSLRTKQNSRGHNGVQIYIFFFFTSYHFKLYYRSQFLQKYKCIRLHFGKMIWNRASISQKNTMSAHSRWIVAWMLWNYSQVWMAVLTFHRLYKAVQCLGRSYSYLVSMQHWTIRYI